MLNKKVSFEVVGTDWVLPDKKKIVRWIELMVSKEGKTLGRLHIVFCSDEYLLKINHKYLKHNTLTDVMTFDYCNDNVISGEIYISIERVKENAGKYSQKLLDEVRRVIIHGVLHLLGYNDKSEEENVTMHKKEDFYLNWHAI